MGRNSSTIQVAAIIQNWLVSGDARISPGGKYRHRLFKENSECREDFLPELRRMVLAAHDDACQHLREILGPENPAYPGCLHIQTLKGYFGEVLSGLIVENFAPHGEPRWRVPAYLFRFHHVAFQELERCRQTGAAARQVPGRTGDDCLAFCLDDQGEVEKSMVCEAKCTGEHDASLVSDAHDQLSRGLDLPVSLYQVIEVLESRRDDPEARPFAAALRRLRQNHAARPRYDLIAYVCGRPPVRQESWVPRDRPHQKYTAGRHLEVDEIHLSDVDGLVSAVYRGTNSCEVEPPCQVAIQATT